MHRNTARRNELAQSLIWYRNHARTTQTLPDVGLTVNDICRKMITAVNPPPKPEPPKPLNYQMAVHDCTDGDWWCVVKLASKEDYPTIESLDPLICPVHYGGPGRGFTREPSIEENRFSWLIRQSGGRDV